MEDRQTRSNWFPRKTSGTFLRHTSESGHLRQLSFSTLLLASMITNCPWIPRDWLRLKKSRHRATVHLLRYFVDNVHSPTHRPWSLQRFQQLLSRFCSVGFFDLGLVGMLWCEGRTKDTDQDLYSPKSQNQQNTLFASDLVSSCHWSRENWWWYHTTARDTRPMPGETVQNMLCPNLFFSFGFGSSFCLLLLLASSNALHVALRIQVIPK